MLALVVASPDPVRDGLVALLEASPDIRQILQITQADDALEIVETISPDITLIHASPLSPELKQLISRMKQKCYGPLLVIVDSEEERKASLEKGADAVVFEGLPSAKLASLITSLLPYDSPN